METIHHWGPVVTKRLIHFSTNHAILFALIEFRHSPSHIYPCRFHMDELGDFLLGRRHMRQPSAALRSGPIPGSVLTDWLTAVITCQIPGASDDESENGQTNERTGWQQQEESRPRVRRAHVLLGAAVRAVDQPVRVGGWPAWMRITESERERANEKPKGRMCFYWIAPAERSSPGFAEALTGKISCTKKRKMSVLLWRAQRVMFLCNRAPLAHSVATPTLWSCHIATSAEVWRLWARVSGWQNVYAREFEKRKHC